MPAADVPAAGEGFAAAIDDGEMSPHDRDRGLAGAQELWTEAELRRRIVFGRTAIASGSSTPVVYTSCTLIFCAIVRCISSRARPEQVPIGLSRMRVPASTTARPLPRRRARIWTIVQ